MFECHALTDIWTAGENAKLNDRLRLTGLLGSIRWWSEAIVRGFGVRACDPVSEPCRGDQHCVICELFGKADPPQAAKFAIRAWEDANRRQPFTRKLSKGSTVILEFHFYRDRNTTLAEKYLLVKAMDVISRYGSVGGKTTLKPTRPSDIPTDATAANQDRVTRENAKKAWLNRHSDYGLLKIKTVDGAEPQIWKSHQELFEREMGCAASSDQNFCLDLPSLSSFWFLPASTLFVHPSPTGGDNSINNLLGLADTFKTRDDRQLTPKLTTPPVGCNPLRLHLRGLPERFSKDPLASSKKVFSFGSMGNNGYARTWGYVLNQGLLTHLPDLLISAGITKTAVDGEIVLREPIGG
jgi:CRISPR type III-B/RAMP module RAMP protein Cmr1